MKVLRGWIDVSTMTRPGWFMIVALLLCSRPPAQAQVECVADCNSDARVTVNELIAAVNIALGAAAAGCPRADVNGDSMVTVAELVQAVNDALDGGVHGTEAIDVGGHRLRIDCLGSGGPTAVFDAGNIGVLEAWRMVQPAVGGFTRACAYDRAGQGQSDPGPLPRTSEQMVSELHGLLTNGCLPGPYVLVGHSLGGLNIHLYASTYPDDVAGLVFVDGTPAEFCDRWAASGLASVRPCARCVIMSGAIGSECLNIELSQDQVQAADPLPDVPTVVFVAGAFQAHSGPPLTDAQSQQREDIWLDLQTDLAQSVPEGMLVVTDCPHSIQDCRPDLITDAIQDIVESARSHHE